MGKSTTWIKVTLHDNGSERNIQKVIAVFQRLPHK